MSFSDVAERIWLTHKMQHNVTFSDVEEDNRRLGTFKDNHCFIENVNATKGITFTCCHNQLSHWSHEEYVGWLNSETCNLQKLHRATKKEPQYIPQKKKHVLKLSKLANLDVPKEIDWCKKNVITAVKNQGVCGSCWAFAAAGAIESGYAIKCGKLESLSVQQLLDCSDESCGCNGGFPHKAFEYATKNALTTEEAYPYKEVKGKCMYNGKRGVKIDSLRVYARIDGSPYEEESLMKITAKVGPSAIGIDASSRPFAFYQKGIYNNHEKMLNHFLVNHAVLLVGYGTDDSDTTKNFWKIKNSWGPLWGERGYCNIHRNGQGYLGVSSYYAYPKF